MTKMQITETNSDETIPQKRGIKDYPKYEENTFKERLREELQADKYRKYRYATRTDKKAILTAVDANGEPVGHTSFVQQYEVDPAEFTKIFKKNLKAFTGIKAAGQNVFNYIQSILKPGQDAIIFSIDKCKKFTGYNSPRDIYNGLTELIDAEIISRSEDFYIYYINPTVFFNGNRITYIKTYVQKPSKEDPNQLEINEIE